MPDWQQIASEDVEITEDPRLQDGMGEAWSRDAIAERVQLHIDRTGTSVVVTFDEGGVSGHPNHCAIASALR